MTLFSDFAEGSFSFFMPKSQKLFELRQMVFCPAMNFGESGEVAEESEQSVVWPEYRLKWREWWQMGEIDHVLSGDRALFSGIERRCRAKRERKLRVRNS